MEAFKVFVFTAVMLLSLKNISVSGGNVPRQESGLDELEKRIALLEDEIPVPTNTTEDLEENNEENPPGSRSSRPRQRPGREDKMSRI